jgi:hypothetical protein
MKPTILIDRAGDVRLYEIDGFGGVDEIEWTPTKWNHKDNISLASFEARKQAAHRVFEEVAP